MAEILPSSAPRETRDIVFGEHDFAEGKIAWVRVFCASCHQAGPRVPEVQLQSGGYVCYVCEPCAVKYQDQTAFAVVPDEVFFQKCHEAQLEAYDRLLSTDEIIDQLGDPNSLCSKLARARY